MTNTITPEIASGNFENQESTNTVTPEIASGNLENQEDINQSSNNFQSSSTNNSQSSTGSVEEPVIEDTEKPAEEPGTVYPQQWATGTGTVDDPWVGSCIESAYASCPAGGTIFLKTGYYQLADQLTITKQINIIGEGRNKTIIKTADAIGFKIDGVSYITIKNLTIDGDAQTDGLEFGLDCICISGQSGNPDYILMEDIEVKNAGRVGITVGQVNYSTFKNIYTHDNYEHGMHSGSYIAGRNKYNTYRDIYAWNNGHGGFDDRGIGEGGNPPEDSYNIFDNLQCWDNVGNGISIGLQNCGVISNSFVIGNGNGIYLYSAKNINFTNVIVKNNAEGSGYYGIAIQDCSDIALTACQSYDDRETPLQLYGMDLWGTNNTGIILVNCKLTPNAISEIYNPNSVAVKVITEKMLAKF